MKLNLKERKGITLIALVITIIVLLILAGVSVAMLTGQNGILTQAQKAKTTTDNKSAEEKVKLAVMAARSQSEDASLDLEKLTAEVTTNYGGQVDGGAFPATVTIDGKTFTVDSNGNVTSKDSETAGKVTIIEGDGKSVGNIIEVTSTKKTKEKFYVLSYDESTQKAKALAEWNLKVGNIYNNSSSTAIATDSDGYGLQNKEMKGWVSSGQPYNGVLAFSNSWYFKDTFANCPVDKDGKSYVYDSNSNLYTYVNKYKELLGNTDKVSEVSLASYADINALWSNKSEYPWLFNTSFWLGSASAASNSYVWHVSTDGYRGNHTCDTSDFYGVRPVITVDMSKI
jgi:FlaG/FlaF family flagellin (archaellin)